MIKFFLLKKINHGFFYKYLIAVSFLFFSGLSLSDSFDFKFSNNQEYIKSIKNIREEVADSLPNVPDIRVLNSLSSYSHVRFISDRNNIIEVVLSNSNLYVVGFVSGDIFYRFNDPDFSSVTVQNTTLQTMNVSSHYSNLSSRADRTRASVIVNQSTINEAVNNLFNMNRDGTVSSQEARSLLTLIIGVSESVRFGNISSFISSNYESYTPIGELYTITNQWGRLSDYAYRMSQNASSDAGYYSDVTHATNRNQLHRYLAVANCMNSRVSIKASNEEDECSTGDSIVLIDNTYWPKNLVVVLTD